MVECELHVWAHVVCVWQTNEQNIAEHLFGAKHTLLSTFRWFVYRLFAVPRLVSSAISDIWMSSFSWIHNLSFSPSAMLSFCSSRFRPFLFVIGQIWTNRKEERDWDERERELEKLSFTQLYVSAPHHFNSLFRCVFLSGFSFPFFRLLHFTFWYFVYFEKKKHTFFCWLLFHSLSLVVLLEIMGLHSQIEHWKKKLSEHVSWNVWLCVYSVVRSRLALTSISSRFTIVNSIGMKLLDNTDCGVPVWPVYCVAKHSLHNKYTYDSAQAHVSWHEYVKTLNCERNKTQKHSIFSFPFSVDYYLYCQPLVYCRWH